MRTATARDPAKDCTNRAVPIRHDASREIDAPWAARTAWRAALTAEFQETSEKCPGAATLSPARSMGPG